MNFIDHKYHIWIASLLAGYVQRKGIIKKPKIFELKIIPGVGYVYPAGQWTSLGTGGLAGSVMWSSGPSPWARIWPNYLFGISSLTRPEEGVWPGGTQSPE